jgi:hypothetical protein
MKRLVIGFGGLFLASLFLSGCCTSMSDPDYVWEPFNYDLPVATSNDLHATYGVPIDAYSHPAGSVYLPYDDYRHAYRCAYTPQCRY